ncbi:MAG: hypothetical protein ACK5LO_12010 [Leucobacter sp.]
MADGISRKQLNGAPIFAAYDPAALTAMRSKRCSSVLVLGTNLSAIDLAKSALRYGNRVVLASPSGQLPSVRTNLCRLDQLSTMGKMPDPMRSAFDFLNASSSTDRLLDRSAKILSKGEVFASSAIELLELELHEALVGSDEWQDYVGPFIDWANLFWPLLDQERRKELKITLDTRLSRYISAIPVESAIELINAAQQSRLFIQSEPLEFSHLNDAWHVTFEDGEEDFDLIVQAMGNLATQWSFDSNAILSTNVGDKLRIGADLRVANCSMPVWGVGAVTSDTFPIVNYIRAIVLQVGLVVSDLTHYRVPLHTGVDAV